MNFLNKKTKKEGGFTIIESMIAISIVLVGVLSALILIIRSLALAPLIEDKLVASAVAQDCIERVIQVRNSNYIESKQSSVVGWDDDINGISCTDESGKLSRFFGSGTKLETKSIPDNPSAKEKEIKCTVNWTTKGAPYTLIVIDNLFDWGNLYD